MSVETHVNSTLTSTLQLEFDVTFPLIPCSLLYVDASDVSSQSQSLHLDKKHHVYKRRLNGKGKAVGGRKKHALGGTITDERKMAEHVGYEEVDVEVEVEVEVEAVGNETKGAEEMNYNDDDPEECGSCYGAGTDGECCNTCEDVRRAYRTKGWTFQASDESIAQCAALRKEAKAAKNFDGEGCNVYGNVELLASGGNLHIAPGASLESLAEPNLGMVNDEAWLDLLKGTYESYNVTHTVNKLRFGNSYPGGESQLDGISR